MTTPSAPSKVASQHFLDAQPPLLSQEGTTAICHRPKVALSRIVYGHDSGDILRAAQLLIERTLTAVPYPARQTNGIDSRPRGKLVDGNARMCAIAAPFAFARHH